MDLWTVIDNVLFGIEIDEHQHKRYEPEYEERRYNDLFMGFPGRYVLLRINPDPFKRSEIKQDPSFEARLPIVEAKVCDLLDTLTQEQDDSAALVQVHHLFFGD